MNRLRNRLGFVWLTAPAIVLTIAFRLLSVTPADVVDSIQPYHDQTVQLVTPGQYVGQSFIAASNGLDRIDVMLAESGCPLDTHVNLKLFDATAKAELATSVSICSGVHDPGYVSFIFPKIAYSKATQFRFTLESPDLSSRKYLSLSTMSWNNYPEGSFFLADQPYPGELTFRTHYQSSLFCVLPGGNAKNPWRSRFNASLGKATSRQPPISIFRLIPGRCFQFTSSFPSEPSG